LAALAAGSVTIYVVTRDPGTTLPDSDLGNVDFAR
jgi:hypothetical protein